MNTYLDLLLHDSDKSSSLRFQRPIILQHLSLSRSLSLTHTLLLPYSALLLDSYYIS